ncbi:response regulator [Allosphingosinicella deserti]|uniref:histidine kinase n=1 Tax=Allosphingosinicella deserti TaxID=2116704 RepID=A0A2P7QNP5_9SPHN|nr:response regulator [Sphingomonas deserti]PSJ39593.1 hybrid sensor histidine kinase/response regulator [Sphingomonas deserti]
MTGAADDVFLVIAPSGRDAKVVGDLLGSAGLAWQGDNDGEALLEALTSGNGAGAIITDDALSRIDPTRLRDAIERQPPWSDFPFVLLTRRGETRQGSRAIEELVNVTILERPLHPASLISAARAALRGRRRQRLAARHLADLEAAQAQLRELAGSLEAKVRERTRDLAAANDRLTAEIAEREKAESRLLQAQKMEAVGQLTGGIAHDFNNLLTAIVGSLDLLLRRTDDERLRRLAGNALEAGERGARLTGQLLAFSRRQRLSPTPVQPNEIVSGMGDLLARSIGPHVRVETRLDPNLWQALADPTQLEVMILNLAINARDAMPSGGRLTISTANLEHVPTPLETELSPGEYVTIAVADTGSGMSPAVLARAFEPFFTTKEQGKGTGLGLAQLYGFAKQSGGTARIESREGEGTKVTIYLPRTRLESQSEAPRQIEIRPAPRTRVLVVDDDDDVRLVAAAMVEELGYDVIAEPSGEAALKRLEQQNFSLLLTDVAMPGMNGVELAARASEIRPDLPVLFASGYADIQTFGDELSEDRLLKKPYRIADVAARIAAVLSAHRTSGDIVPLRRS